MQRYGIRRVIRVCLLGQFLLVYLLSKLSTQPQSGASLLNTAELVDEVMPELSKQWTVNFLFCCGIFYGPLLACLIHSSLLTEVQTRRPLLGIYGMYVFNMSAFKLTQFYGVYVAVVLSYFSWLDCF